MSDSVVPNRFSEGSYSHIARPHPSDAPTVDIIFRTAWNSG